MPTATELSRLSCFRKVSLEALQRVASLWVEVHLRPGAVLWTAGEPARDIGVLVEGEMVVEVMGEVIARIRPGELLGETGVYGGGHRNATVRAVGAGRMWLITDSDLSRVRAGILEVYQAIVDQALFQVVQRIRRADEMITARAPGDMIAPTREKLVGLARMWRALVPGGPSTPCPPLAPLLRRVKGLGKAPPEAVIALGTCFRPQPMSEGEVLFLQAERGDWAFLIAEGDVDVVRHVHGGKGEKLARVGRGTLVGINALIDAGPRTASCVAASPGWIYRIEMEQLRAPPAAAAIWWKDTLLINLATQLHTADESLARLRMTDDGNIKGLSDISVVDVEPVTSEEELPDLATAEVEPLTMEEPRPDDSDGQSEPVAAPKVYLERDNEPDAFFAMNGAVETAVLLVPEKESRMELGDPVMEPRDPVTEDTHMRAYRWTSPLEVPDVDLSGLIPAPADSERIDTEK